MKISKSQSNKIINYCNKKKIFVEDLAIITSVNRSQLYKINESKIYNVRARTLEKIYQGTKQAFKKGLEPKDYLDFECFK